VKTILLLAILAGGVEMPTLYYYSPHMALTELALTMGNTVVAKAALQPRTCS
jgi:hypothetical protein